MPLARPVFVAPSGVRLAEPGELTLITSPLASNAKLCGASILEGSVPVAGTIDQSFVSSSAMNPSLNSAPGSSSVRKRKLSNAQLAVSGTVRFTRRVTRSLTPARGPSVGSVLPFSPSTAVAAGSTWTASPDERIAKLVPGLREVRVRAVGHARPGCPAGGIGVKSAPVTPAELDIAVARSPAVRSGVTAALAEAGRTASASAAGEEGDPTHRGEASGPRPVALPPGGRGGAARSAHEQSASG